MIPISEAHLRAILDERVTQHNHGRPHSASGPGVPDPPNSLTMFAKFKSRHRLETGVLMHVKSVLRGVHHEYALVAAPASV